MIRQRQSDDRRKGMQKGRPLTVEVIFTPAPDPEQRLARGYDLILRAAARAKKVAAHDRTPIQNDEREADNVE